jgi:hypothetical protein
MNINALQKTVVYRGERFHDVSIWDTKVDLSNPSWMVDLSVELAADYAKGMGHCLGLELGKMKNLAWFYFGLSKDVLQTYNSEQTYNYLLDQFRHSNATVKTDDSETVADVEAESESDRKRSASSPFQPIMKTETEDDPDGSEDVDVHTPPEKKVRLQYDEEKTQSALPEQGTLVTLGDENSSDGSSDHYSIERRKYITFIDDCLSFLQCLSK